MPFDAAAEGVSFGRYINSIGDELYPAQISNTFPGTNSGPRVGPVVINEIHYHPAQARYEFIELFNITSTNVALFDPARPTNTWQLSGLGFTFPTNITIPPFGFIILGETNPALVHAQYSIPTNVQVSSIPADFRTAGRIFNTASSASL